MMNGMDIGMEIACEIECIFEDSVEIDFDYEFDAAMYHDFSRVETDEEVKQSELWFFCAQGYPPSPLVDKLNWNVDDLEDTQACSSVDGHQNKYSTSNYKKDERSLKPKAKSSAQASWSRLLKPTASHLAKLNQQTNVHLTKTPIRSQKYGSGPQKFAGESKQELPKCVTPSQSVGRSRSTNSLASKETGCKVSSESTATKRQKLEIGYSSKIGHLKHPTHFPHKVEANHEVISQRKPKIITPKETNIETPPREHRNRPNGANNSKSNRSSTSNASLQEQSNPIFKFKASSLDKKSSVSNKDSVGVSRMRKSRTTNPKEFKLSSNKKDCQSAPAEIFNKNGLKKNVPCSIMKETKNSNVVTSAYSRINCSKGNQFRRDRINVYAGNHPTNIRGIAILSS